MKYEWYKYLSTKKYTGEYDPQKGIIVKREWKIRHYVTLLGPTLITAYDAGLACRRIGQRLAHIDSLDMFRAKYSTFTILNHYSNLTGYDILFWIFGSNQENLYTQLQKDKLSNNCDNLLKFKTFHYYKRKNYNEDTYFEKRITLSNDVLFYNKQIFCAPESNSDKPFQIDEYFGCTAIMPNEYCEYQTFIFVPCELLLPAAVMICEQRDVKTSSAKHLPIVEMIHQMFTKMYQNSTFSEKNSTDVDSDLQELLVARIYNTNSPSLFTKMNPNSTGFVSDIKKIRELARLYQKTNSSSYFQCSDFTFILNHHVCDGLNSCSNGEDEKKCRHVCFFNNHAHHSQECFESCHKSNCSCDSLYFQCNSGGCVPSSKICDTFNDCADKSDESAHLCPLIPLKKCNNK